MMTSVTNFQSSSIKYHSGSAVDAKSEEQKEMDSLLEKLPVLNDYFHLHSKIGQGTFSTVYLATLKNSNLTQKYAVKHLIESCEESAIQNEFRCLTEIGGKDNVVPAELCLTNGKNCVTFIMPYLAHHKFSDYVVDMDAEETRFYMKNLFIALKRVHSFNIIHRDVKPNNFLYNRETKQFLLVDFGLAQVVRTPNTDISVAGCSVDENKPIDYSKKRKRSSSSDDEKIHSQKENKRIALKSKDNNVKVLSAPKISNETKAENEKTATKVKGDLNSPLKQWTEKPDVGETPIKSRLFSSVGVLTTSRRKLLDSQDSTDSSKNVKSKSLTKSKKTSENSPKLLQNNSFTPLVSAKSSSGNFLQIRNSRVVRQQTLSSTPKSYGFPRGMPSTSSLSQYCFCSGKGAVCSTCSSKQPMCAPRAGTSGFRPPEVLFKYIHQTTAVDMWSSGVVMLCILSGCYPFFNSPTDLVSLAEVMTIFGTEPTISVAKKFGRKIICSEYRKEMDLKKLCIRLRARSARKSRSEKSNSNEPKCRDCFQSIRKDGCLCRSKEVESSSDTDSDGVPSRFPDSAYDLLYRLLDLDPTTRITAAEALEHPFITGQRNAKPKDERKKMLTSLPSLDQMHPLFNICDG